LQAPPEHALGSVRNWIATGAVPRARGAAEARAIVQAAGAQRVLGLLTAGPEHGWPAPSLKLLRRRQRRLFSAAVRQLEAASRVLHALEERGLRALPIKGAALSEALYDAPGERAMLDVDVLILEARRFPDAVRVVEDLGFRPVERATHAWGFASAAAALELHHDVTSCPGLFPVDAEGLWRRSRPGRGLVPRVPSPEDALVMLAVHAAFQHELVLSLGQYLDVRRLLERCPPATERLMEAAARARAETALAATLTAAAVTVAAPVDAGLASALDPHLPRGLRQWLARRAGDPLAFVEPAVPSRGRVRWEICSGRRVELIRRSLYARPPGSRGSLLRGTARAALRAGSLARRWLMPI
jgi:hypothetical protein